MSNYILSEINEKDALQFVQKWHYSNTLPKLNKHFIGFYVGEEMVGLVTLGWGTRPLQTIQCLFPSLTTENYFEIGRMCMLDSMPRNSESQMISDLCKYIKSNYHNVKILFTFADGMLGKCGYVYQASGFIYVGYSVSDIYLKDGVKIHPRQTQRLFKRDENDTRMSCRPTIEQMKQYNITHYKGKQYKYIRFLCGKHEKKKLMKECLVPLDLPKPKDKDLSWQRLDLDTREWVSCSMPNYKTDCKSNKQQKTLLTKSEQMGLNDFIDIKV